MSITIKKIRILIYKYPFLRMLLFPAIFVRRFLLNKKFSYQQEMYDNLCEIIVEDPVIRVDEFQGIFTMDCRSDLCKRLLLRGSYESAIAKFVLKYIDKNRDAIDVGANIGFYTILFAKNIDRRKVLSIEPTTDALKRLYRNIYLNHIESNTIVFEAKKFKVI